MKLNVFDIQRFSIHDGPGIRTTVFLKGCSLRCGWCHNPESISAAGQVRFMQAKCLGCGTCRQVCPALDSGLLPLLGNFMKIQDECLACRKCVEACPSQALEIVGKEYESEDLMEILLRDREFYTESSGGVTFSGGEPLLQSKALKMLIKELADRNIHCAVETAGNVPWQAFEDILDFTGLYLYDIKAVDNSLHLRGTGSGNTLILSNFKKLYEAKANIIVRIPVIPGFNDTPAILRETAFFLADYPEVKTVELMPFHKLAQHKYENLRMPYSYGKAEEPDAGLMRELNGLFHNAQN